MSLRRFIRPHFDEAGSWSDLEGRISEQGLGIHAKGQGLIFSDGEAYAKLSQLGGKQHRLALLEARFGNWKSYDKERRESSRGFTRNDGLTKDEHTEIEKRLAAHKRRRAKARDRNDGLER